jgi:ATP-dependent RNA helicase RhlE
MQIHAEIMTLAKFTGLKAATIFGGVPSGPQIRNLRARPDILIVCPGRLLDLAEQRYVKLDAIETLVLDEADHMFDMGFLPDLRRILDMLPAKRQNLLFSATMPNEIRTLADRVLQTPHVVELSHSKPAPTIDHAIYVVSTGQKLDLLNHVLAADKATSAIVFMRTKHRAKRLALQLSRVGHQAVSLEGNMSQAQRDRAMNGFRAGQFKVLVATDIAARGVDVAHVSHVINFDVPTTPDAYTHRIGRTGRAERSGRAYTFAAVDELPAVHAIERRLKAKITRLEVPAFNNPVVAPAESRERMVETRAVDAESTRGPRNSWGQRRHGRRPGAGRFTKRLA